MPFKCPTEKTFRKRRCWCFIDLALFAIVCFFCNVIQVTGKTAEMYPDSIKQILLKPHLSDIEIDSLNAWLVKYLKEVYVNDEVLRMVTDIHDRIHQSNYKKGLLNAKISMSTAQMGKANVAAALKNSMGAYQIAAELKDTAGMIRSDMQTGIGYYIQKNYEKSMGFYLKALELAKKSNHQDFIFRLDYLIAIDLTQLNRHKEASEKFLPVLSYHLQRSDTLEATQVRVYLAELFLKMDKPQMALNYIVPAYEYLVKTRNFFGIAKSVTIMASVYRNLGEPKRAIEYGKTAAQIADSLSAFEMAMEAYHLLYLLSRETGALMDAITYSERYHSLKDTIFNNENSRLIAELESQQLIAQKQSEILLLEKEKRNNDLLLKGSLLLGLMFLLLFVVLYSRYVIRQRANKELAKAYQNLRNTQEQLISHEKMASLGQLTAGIAHEIKNPLNFVNNFSTMSIELLDELKNSDDKKEQADLINDLSNNLEKIHKHGQRADSIVKSMLEHSRTGNADQTLNDINRICAEFLNLTYQGIKALHPTFSCEIIAKFDPSIPPIKLAGQEISRVLINIFNNAFYAVQKKALTVTGFKPILDVSTSQENGFVVIRIRDNGTGISKEIREKIFEPFFTTKPAGEGTGLGLSISYEIISAHGGRMEVEAEEGSFTQFNISLPVAATGS
jgi:two-component system NtrC family sensor kinase